MSKSKNKIKAILGFTMATLLYSCQKDAEIGGTAVQDMSGDWHVRVNETGSYFTLYTFNTSDNSPNLMWVQGTGLKTASTAIGVKGKVPIVYSDKTFGGENIENIAATKADIPEFSIASGKIIPNGTVGPASKSPTDSIYFELNVNGVVYKVSGFHKTGFLEDLP